jgi:hypothetical protein
MVQKVELSQSLARYRPRGVVFELYLIFVGMQEPCHHGFQPMPTETKAHTWGGVDVLWVELHASLPLNERYKYREEAEDHEDAIHESDKGHDNRALKA